MSANMTSRGPGIEKIKADMEVLMRMDVLVGIPEEKASRPGDSTINNAELLYIHTHGSPLRGIPARPVIEPAITAPDNKEKITEQLGIAAKLILDGQAGQAKQQLKKVAMLGQNIARGWFTDPRNGWAPNSPATINRKVSKMSKKKIKEAKDAGLPLSSPLIDTGQMRKAIVGIVREKHD